MATQKIVAKDTIYQDMLRRKQIAWRERRGYGASTKTYIRKVSTGDGLKEMTSTKPGNYLDEEGIALRYNFLTPVIERLVEEELASAKKNGKRIGDSRIWEDLLSSKALCFNLFGELKYDLDLATEVFSSLFPFVGSVTGITFEEPSGEDLTGEHLAFDVFVEYNSIDREKCFMGIVVKYQESMREASKKKTDASFFMHKDTFQKIYRKSGVFVPGAEKMLQSFPIRQLWMYHILALSILQKNDYEDGCFVFLCPGDNLSCIEMYIDYRRFLVSEDPAVSKIMLRDIDSFVDMLESFSDAQWIQDFKSRYL